MTSVERILEYSKLRPEAPLYCKQDKHIEPDWPSEGAIKVNNVFMNYNDDDGDVLKDVSFNIESGEKVFQNYISVII